MSGKNSVLAFLTYPFIFMLVLVFKRHAGDTQAKGFDPVYGARPVKRAVQPRAGDGAGQGAAARRHRRGGHRPRRRARRRGRRGALLHRQGARARRAAARRCLSSCWRRKKKKKCTYFPRLELEVWLATRCVRCHRRGGRRFCLTRPATRPPHCHLHSRGARTCAMAPPELLVGAADQGFVVACITRGGGAGMGRAGLFLTKAPVACTGLRYVTTGI